MSILRNKPTLPYWGYLLAATAGEVAAVYVPLLGLGIYTALLIAMLTQGVMSRDDDRCNLALALVPAPLIRLLSLTMPLLDFPRVAWYPMVAVPLIVAVWLIARQAGFSRGDLGLRIGNLPAQVLVALFGPALGIIEFVILKPAPLTRSEDIYEIGFYSLVLLIFTGLNEELIFRGLMQAAAGRVLGRSALLFVSILFGVLHIGYMSVPDLVFVTGVGLAFAYLVRWGGSILGVTLVHGLTNITLFIVAPLALADMGSDAATSLFAVAGAGVLFASIGTFWIYRSARRDNEAAAQQEKPTYLEKPGDLPIAYARSKYVTKILTDTLLASIVQQ